jgi:hypothetical protein
VPREEDRAQRGWARTEISPEGFSKPLGYGERRALEQQAKNRRLSDGKTPGEFEERNLNRISTDLAMKQPRRCSY